MTLDSVVGRWKGISAVGGFAASLVTAVMHEPPADDPKAMIAMGAFIAAVVTGLAYVAMRRWSKKKHRLAWVAVALVTLAAFYAGDRHYDRLRDNYVGIYQEKAVAVGDEFTPAAVQWMAATHHAGVNQLLFDAHGDVFMFWTESGLARVRSALSQTYFMCYPLLTLCLMATVQAVAISEVMPRKAAVTGT